MSDQAADHDDDLGYTLARISAALRLSRELSCSQDATFMVTLKVAVECCGQITSLVAVEIKGGADAAGAE